MRPIMVRAGETSSTADGSCAARALSARIGTPRNPDHLANRLLGPAWQRMVFALGRWCPWVLRAAWRTYHDKLPGILEAHLARTLFYDEAVREALEPDRGGCEQYVILGAGLDSRAYRFAEVLKTANIKVFEVDFAATSRNKRARLSKARIECAHVTYVECDFLKEKFYESLLSHGFDPKKRTIVTWEGVTMYLNDSVVRETCELVATFAPGSTIIYDYVLPAFFENPSSLPGAKKHNEFVLKTGEPYTFGHVFEEYPKFIESCGLRVKTNISASELDARYLAESQTTSCCCSLPRERHVTPWYCIGQAIVP